MSFMNFRTMILCGVCWLCTYSMSVYAQDDFVAPGEVVIDFSPMSQDDVPTTGDNIAGTLVPSTFSASDGRDFFETTTEGVQTFNTLISPITFNVAEAPGLQVTIENATSTTGIDGAEGDNRAFFNVSGLGLSLRGPAQREDPDVAVGTTGAVPANIFRLDATHDEFITISFNADVTVFGLGVTNLDDGETFAFGSAVDLTNDNVVEDVLGVNPLSGNPNVDFLPFAVPLEITAGEEILLGNTGFITNPTAGNAGVGFEQILLTVTGDLPTPAIPEPSSIAVLGLGGLLMASRRRRG